MVMPPSEREILGCRRGLKGQIDLGLFIAKGLVRHPCISGDQFKIKSDDQEKGHE